MNAEELQSNRSIITKFILAASIFAVLYIGGIILIGLFIHRIVAFIVLYVVATMMPFLYLKLIERIRKGGKVK